MPLQLRAGEEHAPRRTPQGPGQHPQGRGSHQAAETGSGSAGRLGERGGGGGSQSPEPKVENLSKTKTFLSPHGFTAASHFRPAVSLPCSIEEILAESDSDLSEDEGKAGRGQKRGVKFQKGRAWLKEGQEDDPLNFLDPKVSQRVLGNLLIYSRATIKKRNVVAWKGFFFFFYIYLLVSQPPTRP